MSMAGNVFQQPEFRRMCRQRGRFVFDAIRAIGAAARMGVLSMDEDVLDQELVDVVNAGQIPDYSARLQPLIVDLPPRILPLEVEWGTPEQN